MATELLRAKAICLSDAGKPLLQNVNLAISAGEIITLIGPNGAGKTSLLNILLGLRKPSSGEVLRKGNLRVGYMPQRLALNPQLPLTVERFLTLADQSLANIELALNRVGIDHLQQANMHSLSGGEVQRVMLARALLRKPQLLVLDEPLQGVDIVGQGQLYQLIGDLRDELNAGVLMVSHDLHLVMAGTDQVICLNQHICCQGHPESVSTHPAYLELFGPVAANLATYSHHHDHKHNLRGEVIKSDSQSRHRHHRNH